MKVYQRSRCRSLSVSLFCPAAVVNGITEGVFDRSTDVNVDGSNNGSINCSMYDTFVNIAGGSTEPDKAGVTTYLQLVHDGMC